MSEDGALAPDARHPSVWESRVMSVIKQNKAIVFLVAAFAIMIVVGVLTT